MNHETRLHLPGVYKIRDSRFNNPGLNYFNCEMPTKKNWVVFFLNWIYGSFYSVAPQCHTYAQIRAWLHYPSAPAPTMTLSLSSHTCSVLISISTKVLVPECFIIKLLSCLYVYCVFYSLSHTFPGWLGSWWLCLWFLFPSFGCCVFHKIFILHNSDAQYPV